jgi:hypothetical protein
VITEAELVRVSSSAIVNLLVRNTNRGALREKVGGRVNALEAFSRNGMKRMLNAVVEVRYTTAMLEVAG